MRHCGRESYSRPADGTCPECNGDGILRPATPTTNRPNKFHFNFFSHSFAYIIHSIRSGSWEDDRGRVCSGDRSGDDVDANVVFDGEMRIAGAGQKEFTQIYPQSGWVEHDRRRSGVPSSTIKMAIREAKISAKGHRGHRDHQPARDSRRLGAQAASRSTMPSSGRTGAPPAICDKLKKQDPGKDLHERPGCCSILFLRHQAFLDAGQCEGARARAAK